MKTKPTFTKRLAKEIAANSFGYVIDSITGLSGDRDNLDYKADMYEQNFTEDLEEKGLLVTEHRIKIISDVFNEMQQDMIEFVRKRYDKKYGKL